jgi:streptomycin 6-kinase
VRIPASLGWWSVVPGGSEWLERLPALAASCAEQWKLRLGAALTGGNVALVVAATREDGTAAVLKVSFPDDESEHEGDALAHWDGAGAVRVLERDDERRALLLERVSPGSPLWHLPDDEQATFTAASLLSRLHGVALGGVDPYRSLRDVASRWSESIPADWLATGRAYDRRLLAVAVDACRTLPLDEPGSCLLHQDFHGGNVLRSERDGWLAIDPKPLVGDAAFDAASLLRDRRWLLGRPDDASRIRRRLDVLAETTGLDRERMRLWGIVHALAWGVSGRKVEPDMIRCAELLLDSA